MPRATRPERLEKADALLLQATDLLRQAFLARHDLLAASDGLLQLNGTLSIRAELPVVLKPVMALHPNRKSLLFGAAVLAPQSGGMQDQVDLLGTRHARMSLYIPVYDAATCAIDAAFFTPYAEGPRLYAARPPLNPAQSPARLVRCSPSSTNLTPP